VRILGRRAESQGKKRRRGGSHAMIAKDQPSSRTAELWLAGAKRVGSDQC
jgi:hypothetical protein